MTTDNDPLGAVLRAARALDALAAGSPTGSFGDPALELLGALRDEVDRDLTALAGPGVGADDYLLDLVAAGVGVSEPAAALLAALRAEIDAAPEIAASAAVSGVVGLDSAPRRRRRALRIAVVAATLGAGHSTSGVAAAALSSHPGGTFYSLRTVVFGRTDDDPEVPRGLLRQAQRELDLAVASPDQSAEHVAASRIMVARAQSLLPRVHDGGAVSDLSTRGARLQTAIRTVPVRPARAVAAGRPGPATAVAVPLVTAGGAPGQPGATPTGGAGAPTSTPSADPSAAVTPGATTSAEPTPSPEVTPSGQPSPTAAPTPSTGASETATPSPGATPSSEPAPVATATAMPDRTQRASPRPSATATATPAPSAAVASPRPRPRKPPAPRKPAGRLHTQPRPTPSPAPTPSSWPGGG